MPVRRRRQRLAFDTETTGLNVWTGARPFAVSVCWENGETAYWEWDVNPRTRVPMVPLRDVRELRAILSDRSTRKYTWNGKFDCLMLDAIGIEVPRDTIDEVSFAARCVHNLEFAYKLKPLAKKYARIPDDDEKDLHGMVVKARRLAKRLGYSVDEEVEPDYWMPGTLCSLHPREAAEYGIDGSMCQRYAVRDSERTMVLGMFYDEAMDDLPGTRKAYELELSLMPVTEAMERRGVVIDLDRVSSCREQCEGIVTRRKAELDAASQVDDPEGFNINSPKQVGDLLFGPDSVAKLPVLKRTKTGQPKTDAEALAPHKRHPLVESVLALKANSQALKLFFDKYERLVTDDGDGLAVLHPGYKQYGTLTARYACSEPNLQAVSDPDTTNSIAAEFVVDVRQVFVPRPGCVWYCPDYSQIEVVVFADVSGEQALMEAIRTGQDIHGVTAEKVWGGEGNDLGFKVARMVLDTDDDGYVREQLRLCNYRVTDLEKKFDKKTYRKRAKSVTFTKIFGGGPLALMRWIGCSRPDAVAILGAYDRTFPTMVRRMKEIEVRGKADGFVHNLFGRRLSVDPWNAYRAVNHMVQSSAADLMKRGMVNCARYLRDVRSPGYILLTIHDELIFEFPKGADKKETIRDIKRIMSDHGGAMTLPIKVDVERVTDRWSDKSKVDV